MLNTVRVPDKFAPLFEEAQKYVARYFAEQRADPEHGSLEIGGQRYVLVRAASMSVEFYDMVRRFYGKEEEAHAVAHSLLFDIAHAMGMADAKAFVERMGVTRSDCAALCGPGAFCARRLGVRRHLARQQSDSGRRLLLALRSPVLLRIGLVARRGASHRQPGVRDELRLLIRLVRAKLRHAAGGRRDLVPRQRRRGLSLHHGAASARGRAYSTLHSGAPGACAQHRALRDPALLRQAHRSAASACQPGARATGRGARATSCP